MRAALLLPLLLPLACVDDTPETLTVVVDANRARAQADQARLAEMQAAVDEARQELVRTREDLSALRKKLVAAGAVSAEEARRLEERERSLAAHEDRLPAGAPVGATGAGPALTKAELEALLAAQETRLAALLAQGATAPPAPAAAPAAGGKTLRAEVEALLAEQQRDRDVRGLHLSDLPRGRELLAKAEAQLRADKLDDALATAQALGAEATGVAVDLGFVKQKYARANAVLPSLAGEKQSAGKALLAEANARVAAGDAVGASRKLSAVLLLAE
ncbi:MAG: hypothetical protein IT382_18075 [Deltaproteobacteria bacterium]|nr:hypothetical protein [Deltaproteobacteria bacterium]